MEDQIDVPSDSSSEIEQQTEQQQSESPAESEAAPEQAAAAPQENLEDKVPFHLHPRFQEVIFQKNQLAEQTKALQQQIQEMNQRFQKMQPAQQSEEDKLIARLKGIDPEFGGRFAELDALRNEMKAFKEWQQQSEAQKAQLEISSTKDRLYSEAKVSAEHKPIYEAMLIAEAQRNPQLQISDLPNVFKSVHENISKLLGNIQRETTKNYVQAKTAQAAKPAAQPKGQPVKANSEMQFSKNANEAKAQLIQEVLKQARASKDI